MIVRSVKIPAAAEWIHHQKWVGYRPDWLADIVFRSMQKSKRKKMSNPCPKIQIPFVIEE
jgi:hypothetical protein